MALIPIVISPWGACGGLFNRFLYGKGALPLPQYSPLKPNGLRAARIAMGKSIPTAILPMAAKLWNKEADSQFY
eukprot:12764672-Ditylum_brightwellii.AAC.1